MLAVDEEKEARVVQANGLKVPQPFFRSRAAIRVCTLPLSSPKCARECPTLSPIVLDQTSWTFFAFST
jgi:hypothetical protein